MTPASKPSTGSVFSTPWFRQLSDADRLVWFCLTEWMREQNITGLSYVRLPDLAARFGKTEDAIKAAIDEFVRLRCAAFDPHTGVLWLTTILRPARSVTEVKRWGRMMMAVPDCSIKRGVIRRVYAMLSEQSPGFADAFAEAAHLTGDDHSKPPAVDRMKPRQRLPAPAAPVLTLVHPPVEAPEKTKKPRVARPARKKVTFRVWLSELADKGEAAIPDDQTVGVWRWAALNKVDDLWILIAWWMFKQQHLTNPARMNVLQVDWRRTFLNACIGNWYKIWFVPDGSDSRVLSSMGRDYLLQMNNEQTEAANATA